MAAPVQPQGKTRRGCQKAPPFDWAMPVSGLWESELGTFAHDKWRKFTSSQVSFLLPALTPFRSGVTRATGFALVPMSTAAWQQVLRDLVALAPASWGPREAS